MLNIRLKALDQINNREMEPFVKRGFDRQLIVPIQKDEFSRRPLLVLGELWENISRIEREDSEMVLKFSKYSKINPNLASYIHVRAFSETGIQAYRFTAIITTLRIITQNLIRQSTTTLRDIFYRDVSAFQGSQARLNETLALIANSLGFSMERDFKITPSPKGLIFGGPQIHLVLDEGTSLDLNYSKSILVPTSIFRSFSFKSGGIDAIIIMEKEAVFKMFTEYLQESYIQHNLIVLTGKGNPDKASTRFLSALRISFPDVPICLFVDSDVYGLRILWTYILAAGGPSPSIMFAGTFLLEHTRGYLTIAPREWKLMMNFLKEITIFQETYIATPTPLLEIIKRELKRGMLLGKKAEINVMCETSQGENLNTYLWAKVAHEICNKT